MTTANLLGVNLNSVLPNVESTPNRKEEQRGTSFQQSLLDAQENLSNKRTAQPPPASLVNGATISNGVTQAPATTKPTTTQAVAAKEYAASQLAANLRATATYRAATFQRTASTSAFGASKKATSSNNGQGSLPALAAALNTIRSQSTVGKTTRPNSNAVSGSNGVTSTGGTTATNATAQINSVNGTNSSSPMTLADYPRPIADNGRGMHWVPTVRSDQATVDKYVQEMKDMHVKWAVILNDNCNIGDNDYLVQKLVDNDIMPIMRIYTDGGAEIQGDVKGLVEHYKAMGVDYYQLYNEPNLTMENQGQTPDPKRYVDQWLPAAKAVTEAGGLPGFGALSPSGDVDDMEFFNQALAEIKARGETEAMDHAWIAMHNYTGNRPLDYTKDSDGFLQFRWFDQAVRQNLGRSLPIIGTEGGTFVGVANDRSMPAVSQADQINMVKGAYEYMNNAEPYYFSYTYWAVANEAGGGKDSSFENHALFHANSTNPVVAALKGMADGTRTTLPVAGPSAAQATGGSQTIPTPFTSQSKSAAEKSKAAAAALTKKTTASTATNNPAFGQRMVNEAKKYLGKDYVWGGESPDPGFDCTGFTWYIMQQLDRQFPLHDLEGQSASGKQVSKANLQPGDLIFFQNTYRQGISHVGVYEGNGKFIHAASEKLGVIESRLDEPYWSSRYLSATRPFTK